jgi:hypothetical protein
MYILKSIEMYLINLLKYISRLFIYFLWEKYELDSNYFSKCTYKVTVSLKR